MKYIKLLLGIFLFSVGIVLTIQANLGLAPWDTFHQGLSKQSPLSFGQASMLAGILILVINYILGEKIGIGTIVNVFGIGLIIDVLFKINIIPLTEHLLMGILFMVVGMFTIAIGSYFYLSAGLGSGPRDGLMVGLVKKFNQPLAIIRSAIEISILGLGFLLGGKVGFGTVILAVFIGPIIQVTFNWLRFDVKSVKHNYLFKMH